MIVNNLCARLALDRIICTFVSHVGVHTRCRTQCWCIYSNPCRVMRMYALMLAGVSTRLVSLMITYHKEGRRSWSVGKISSFITMAVFEARDTALNMGGNTWRTDLQAEHSIIQLAFRSDILYNVISLIRSNKIKMLWSHNSPKRYLSYILCL